MAHEYSVNQSDLVLVADAIRTKSETTDALVFPAGFVAAIEEITGGGISVSAYATESDLPSTAEDGTLAVISTTAVDNVYVQSEEPNEPQNGDLWILFSNEGYFLRAVGNVVISIQKALQYMDGGWSDVDMKMYKDSEWKDVKTDLYIFKAGSGLNDDYELVYHAYNNFGGMTDDYIHWSTATNVGATLYFKPQVNFTPGLYKNLCFDVKCTGRYNNSTAYTLTLGVGPDVTTDYDTDGYGSFSAKLSNVYSTERVVHKVDVSGVSGLNYIKLGAFGITGYLYNVWLET